MADKNNAAPPSTTPSGVTILGSGMARQAADNVRLKKMYQDYVADKISNGEEYPTYEEFLASARR